MRILKNPSFISLPKEPTWFDWTAFEMSGGNFFMEEIWKDVVGEEGRYQVSSIGRVKRLEQITCENSQRRKDRKKTIAEKILNQRRSFDYCRVAINRKSFQVHRLVAQAFIPNPENKPYINHKNGIKWDNRVENLEWSTAKENTDHAYDMGLAKSGERASHSKLTDAQVVEIRQLIADRVSDKKIAKIYNVVPGAISNIRYGYTWKRNK